MNHVMRYSLLMVASLLSLFSEDTYATNAELESMRYSHLEKFHQPTYFSAKQPR